MTAKRLNKLKEELAALDQEVIADRSAARRIHKGIPVVGAVVALTGFGTVTWYAYNQGILEGSEKAAPYLRPNGKLKTTPVNPGGLYVPNRDKYVFNILEQREDDGKVERLLPPPVQPKELPKTLYPTEPKKNEVIVAKEKLANHSPRTAKQALEQALDLVERNAPAPILPPAQTQDGSAEAKIKKKNKIPQLDTPRGPIRLTPNQTTTSREVPSGAPFSAKSGKGINQVSKGSNLPPSVSKQTKLLKPSAPKNSSVSIRSQDRKGYYIQLGALRSASAAKRAWSVARRKNPTLLRRQTLSVQRVRIINKGVYYRVQSGPFNSVFKAKKLCDALKRRKQSCILVRRR